MLCNVCGKDKEERKITQYIGRGVNVCDDCKMPESVPNVPVQLLLEPGRAE